MSKPKTNKDRIRDCIIKQGVEHLACWYDAHTAEVMITRKISKQEMQSLADAIFQLSEPVVNAVVIFYKLRDKDIFRFDRNKRGVKLSKV